MTLSTATCYAQGYNINFNDADLNDFSLAAGKALNKTIVVSTPLKGKVSIQGEALTDDEYYDLLLSVLRSYGYSVENNGSVLNITSDAKASKSLGYLNPSPDSTLNNQIVTRVITLQNAQSSDVAANLTSMLADNKGISVVSNNNANLLIATGYADLVNKVANLASSADRAINQQSDVITLENASARPLATELNNLIKANGMNSGNDKISVSADTRTNSILVHASSANLSKMRELISQLDTQSDNYSDASVIYLKYAKASDVEKVIQKVLQVDKDTLSNVVADDSINAIIVNAYGDEQQRIVDMVNKLDIRRAQVHVEAMIVEIANADGINFGVQWGSTEGSLVQFSNGSQLPLGMLAGAVSQARPDKGSTVIDENGNTTVNPDTKGDLSTLLGLLNGYSGAAVGIVKGDWMALVQALKSTSSANILSTPSLTTLDNQKASFIVGEEVPVITGSTASSNNTNPFQTIDRRNVGTKLVITPQINSGNSVQLNINAEVSKVEGNTGVDVVFAERKLDTTVLAENGSMIVLGGLLDEQQDKSNSSVPILGDIPLLGNLFRSSNNKTQKRNLMIFIKPTILRTGMDSDNISQEKYAWIHAQELFKDSFSSSTSSHSTQISSPASLHSSGEIAAFMGNGG
jgi:general secretion pathway protein D